MAIYADDTLVKKGSGAAFDKEWKPGDTPDFAGIYRCKNCGDEIASNKGVKLPSQNNSQHDPKLGDIIWKLTVFAQQK